MTVVAPGAPYVVPEILKSAPTGISWTSLPRRDADAAEQLAEQTNICMRATAMVDGYCRQPLRATIDTERITGPGRSRMQLLPDGTTRLIMRRWPVTQIIGARVTDATAFPEAWTTIATDQLRPEFPAIGTYGTSAPSSAGEGGQSVLLAPNAVTWCGSRRQTVEVQYVNGWPHSMLTLAVTAGATTLPVDDITGWLGAAGVAYDVASQEPILVEAVTPVTTGAVSGPGMLTLSGPLAQDHAAGVLVTALPGTVVWAAILLCVAQALTRGATATTVQNQPGASARSGAGPEQTVADAYKLLTQFRRLV